MGPVTLHRASWIIPVSSPVIADGTIATEDERIIAVGPSAEIIPQFPGAVIKDHGLCALAPALVNAHIHLELSHLPIPQYRQTVTGFTDWIATLLSMREEHGSLGSKAEEEAKKTLRQQCRQGVIALGDIGNTGLGAAVRSEFPGTLIHFNECLGRSAKTRRAILERIAAAPPDRLYTAHAPYSTHAEIIRELKRRAAAYNHPFPIHVAEPPSENDMLCCGTGELHAFLMDRGFIDDTYQPPAGIDNAGSVRYLHELGVLDERTICVHCIHVHPDEVRILAETGAKICLCPGSNRYLRVGRAPAQLFLEHGLLPALGTDSLASNPELSLWREMNILYADNPGIDPADVFAMATLGGASALGIEDTYGSLAPGRSSRFLALPLARDIASAAMLYEYIMHHETIQPAWVNEQ